MNGAESIAQELARHGVRTVFGVGGANIEHLFLAVQDRRPELRAILCKHEHNAGTAADAAARLSGRCGVVMVTSGGGAMNLVPALAEAYASRVPLLALVGEPPRSLQGRGAFQDTSGEGGSVDAKRVLGAVARFCVRVRDPGALPGLVDEAMVRAQTEPTGPAVLLVSRDLQEASVDAAPHERRPDFYGLVVHKDPPVLAMAQARELLREGPILFVVGDRIGRERLVPQLRALVLACDAHVCVTPDGRDAFDNRDPRFLGVLGAMEHSRAATALADAATVVLVGTALPVLARLGSEGQWCKKNVIALHTEPPWIEPLRLVHLTTDLGSTLTALTSSSTAQNAERSDAELPATREAHGPCETFGYQSCLRALSSGLAPDGVVLVDAGNTGAAGVHFVDCPQRGRWLIAMGMAGMGYTFGAAIGAAMTTRERCTVLAGDGAFYMHGLEIHTAVELQLPITYVLFDNRAHGMCLVREALLLGRRGDYNSFRRSELAAGLGAMFPGLFVRSCATQAEFEMGLAQARRIGGPTVLVVTFEEIEIPPFSALTQIAATRGQSNVARSESSCR